MSKRLYLGSAPYLLGLLRTVAKYICALRTAYGRPFRGHTEVFRRLWSHCRLPRHDRSVFPPDGEQVEPVLMLTLGFGFIEFETSKVRLPAPLLTSCTVVERLCLGC